MDKLDAVYKLLISIMMIGMITILLIVLLLFSCKAKAELTTVITQDGPITCSTQGGITICF